MLCALASALPDRMEPERGQTLSALGWHRPGTSRVAALTTLVTGGMRFLAGFSYRVVIVAASVAVR